MGAGQSIQSNLWASTFQMESKNSKVGIIRLTDKQTEDAYICRKISTLDKRQIQQMERLIDIKLSIQSPYVTKLERAETEKHQEYCAYGKNFYVLFKQPFQTLKQQTLNRKFKTSLYSEPELQVMLQIGVKALSFLRNVNHPHENISSTSFFVNENRSIILGDPWMFPKQSTPKMLRNGFIYPSPEVIKYQNNEIELYNPHLSDLFTLGLVLLQVFYMTNMDCVYERSFLQVNYEAIWAKLNPIKSQELKKKLFTILDPQPKNREMIFKHYLKPISSFEVFNQKSKENFKRNVDRYNLATSEVTEWKNELPFQPRLNSSDGKKTFSVSTAENLYNADKGYSYYQRQYGQNHANSTKQNFVQPQNDQGYNQGFMGRQMIREPSYQVDEFSRFKTNQANYVPLQNNLFRTGSSQVKFATSNASSTHNHKGFNIPQTYSSNNLTQSYQPSYSHTLSYPVHQPSVYNPSYSPTYTPNYNFTSNPILNPTTKFAYNIEKPQKNPVPSFTNGFTSQIKLPSPPSYNFTSTYEVTKNTAPLTGSSTSIYSNIQSVNSQIVYKPSEPIPNFDKKPSSNCVSQSSQTSIVIQRQPNLIEGVATQAKQQVTFEETKQQEKKQSPKITEQKPESQTPSVKKPKRKPSDYGHYHHLSTINERSEMTESFVSQNDSRRSQILIQEDNPHSQNDRQNMSEEQNIHQIPEQNKIWSIVYPSGTKYIGEYKNDKRNGLGTFFYIDGSKYHGQWLENKMNGLGTLFYPNGKIAYQGEWKMDNFHGKGKVFNDQIASISGSYRYQDCTDIDNHWLQYDGQLFDDRKEGKGVLKLVNGQYFEGTFVNDELHGPCKFYTLDNKCIEGIWQNSKLVKVLSEHQITCSRVTQQKQ